MIPILASWLVLSAIGTIAFVLLKRGRRLATVPLEWRVVFERVRRRIFEIDADLEIIEWTSDSDGNGSLVLDRNGTRASLPLKELRDAPPALFEERLRELLVAHVPGTVLPGPADAAAMRASRPASRPREAAADPALSPELRQLHPRTP